MTVKFFATYRGITKCSQADLPAGRDIWALLNYLGERYGDQIRKELFTPDGNGIGNDAIILVNGRNILYLNGKDTALAETDSVSIFPLVAGG